MTDIVAAAQAILTQLEAAGIRAVVDGRDVNPPCVQLRPPTVHYRFGRGCVGFDWEARLMVPDVGMSQAWKQLGTLLDAVEIALNYPSPTATPGDTILPDGSTVPTYVLTWSAKV